MVKAKLIWTLVSLLTVLLLSLFWLAPSMVDRSLNRVRDHQPYPVSVKAKSLHQQMIIGDWHADSLLWGRDLAVEHDFGHIDLPRLQRGNVALQMFTTVTKSPSGLNYDENSAETSDSITQLALVQRWPRATWTSLTARALHQADRLANWVNAHPDEMRFIKSQQDLSHFLEQRQRNSNLVGVLLGTEGSHALDGNLSNIPVLFDAGFRMMSLQHFFDNKLGGSLHGQSKAGLTEFGKQAIRKMHELSIIVDLSHSSELVVEQALALSARPFVISHTGFHGHCPGARNIRDDLMQAVAQQGGLIAVGYWQGAVCEVSPHSIAEAIEYGVGLVGADHVALGSDFDGSVVTPFDTSELVVITDALISMGFTELDIQKVMGGNMLRFLQQHLPQI